MKVYFIKNCYSAQIECAGLNLRIGTTCMGVAPSNKFWHRRTIDLPKWYRLLFPLSFGFLYHSMQSDRWYIFNIDLGAFQIWFKTKGERKDEYTGFHTAWRGLKGWKLLF